MNLLRVLYENDAELGESILCDAAPEILHFDMAVKNAFSVLSATPQQMLSPQSEQIRICREALLRESQAYHELQAAIARTESRLKQETLSPQSVQELRQRRKALRKQRDAMESQAANQARKQLFGSAAPRKVLCFRELLYVVALRELQAFLPPLRCLPKDCALSESPLFVENIPAWKAAWEENREIAVEGGPCLFGAYECILTLHLKDGEKRYFDFVTEQMLSPDTMRPFETEAARISDWVAKNGNRVCDVTYAFRKPALTEDELYSLRYVLELAHAFSCKAYIPLPDFSYQKYMDALLAGMALSEAQRSAASAAFHDGTSKIAQLYADAIASIQEQYPDVSVVRIDASRTALLTQYYEKRSEYLQKETHLLKTLTTRALKRESILDYITMPALPFYLDGTREIIQADCLDELDSYRKCRKLHKHVLQIHPCMYPERIGADGLHTAYYAAPENKPYLK